MSNSSTRQTTTTPVPVTAISSTLSTRSNPSLPSASLAYEPLIKSVLARKFVYDVLSAATAASWVLAAVWTSWQRGGVGSLGIFGGIVNWLSPLTLLCTVLWWALASAPMAVLRKTYSQATYSPSVSPRDTLFRHVKERQYQCALAVTLVSAICLTACHAIMAQSIEKHSRDDPRLGIWAGSKKHPYHLNGRLCFLFLSQITCASIYWLRDALRDRFDVRWSNQPDRFIDTFALVFSSLVHMLALSALSTTFSLLLFAVSRSVLLPILYRLPVIHAFLRPFVAHFLRPTYTITFLWSHFSLVIRVFFLALSTLVLWDIPSAMFDAVFSLPATATEARKDAGLVLVSGIHSENAYFQLQAFYGLTLLSSYSDQMISKRAVIYSDTKHNPTLWTTLVRCSLLLLGTDYQLFLRRGNPASPPSVPETPAVKALPTSERPSTPIIRTQVYKVAYTTTIDRIAETLSSDSHITNALTQSNDFVELPKLLRALRGCIHPISIRPQNVSNVVRSTLSSVWHSVRSTLPPTLDITIWWTRERKDKAAQRALPNKELDIMIVQVLSKMVAHSLREDQLGFVQRDIPRVLEALLLFLSSVEDYQRDLSSFVSGVEASDVVHSNQLLVLREEVARAGMWVGELSEGSSIGSERLVQL